MNHAQQKRYQSLHEKHVKALIRQGKAKTTIDVYSPAVRRITEFFDICPDKLTLDHLETYFTALIKTHSWSTVKTDRNGLQLLMGHTCPKTTALYTQLTDVTHQNTDKLINEMISRMRVQWHREQ